MVFTERRIGKIKANSLSKKYTGDRNYSTCIYFLLTSEQFSAFHRIKQSEIWHFYKGSAIHLHTISPQGNYNVQKIGSNLDQGEVPQYVVKGESWFAAEVIEPDSYALIGCTVSPGFSFEDFELKARNELMALYPKHEAIIRKLTNA